MTDSDVVGVYLTFPDESTAQDIARKLVGSRVAACVNVLGTGRSIYRWDDAVVDEPEVFAVAKTTRARLDTLITMVAELHPFDVPCVVAYSSVGGLTQYLDWVETETRV